MTIEILPARLANQIAAGEVVERPASVIKELVENSLDAGATKIQIDVEKGGAKRIRITDNGSGIAKKELMLALSRHATSKIKDLNDLEAISSLGFRGEALASISSVARLTLTSKPKEQDAAWQACAEGRDMDVVIQPAAHPDGTTIDVKDLFFNTPARRKFLRTEKTEFSHIEEVVRRIALARFDVSFILAHNGKVIRQYRAAKDKSQYQKRVAQICGNNFINHAVEVDCQHDDLHLWGWIAKPDFHRSQNDLSYSYVNGRMMRDKLINHAIRQAYEDLLPSDTYPAFVLFLQLDYREVDVNVHPAKHEVRFHQGRYVHDFIYSVCNKALQAELSMDFDGNQEKHQITNQITNQVKEAQSDYIKPLVREYQSAPSSGYGSSSPAQHHYQKKVSNSAATAYQQLMTPHENITESLANCSASVDTTSNAIEKSSSRQNISVLHIEEQTFAMICYQEKPRLLSLPQFSAKVLERRIAAQLPVVKQPLLLPVKLPLSEPNFNFAKKNQAAFAQIGIVFTLMNGANIQIREFPALLREKDVNVSFHNIINKLNGLESQDAVTNEPWIQALSQEATQENYSIATAQALINEACLILESEFEQHLLLNSVVVDLTSEIHQLNAQ